MNSHIFHLFKCSQSSSPCLDYTRNPSSLGSSETLLSGGAQHCSCDQASTTVIQFRLTYLLSICAEAGTISGAGLQQRRAHSPQGAQNLTEETVTHIVTHTSNYVILDQSNASNTIDTRLWDLFRLCPFQCGKLLAVFLMALWPAFGSLNDVGCCAFWRGSFHFEVVPL